MNQSMLAAALSMFLVSDTLPMRREVSNNYTYVPEPHPNDFNHPDQKAKRAAKKKNKS